MNRKQLTLLLVFGLVIGGLGYYLSSRDRASYGQTGQDLGGKLLPEFPMNDVARIVIQDGTNDLHLSKDEGRWRVEERYGYPADFSRISELLRKFWEMKIVQSEEVGPSQWPRLQLGEPGEGGNSGTRLEFADASGKSLATVILGKKHMRQSSGPSQFGNEGWPDGRYLRVAGVDRVALVSDALSQVEPTADRFLSKDFIQVQAPKTISVNPTNAAGAWTLTRETKSDAFTLADPGATEKLDTTKIGSYGQVLANAGFDDVVSPDTAPEVTGLDAPIVARLETFEGFSYTAKIGKKTDADKYHLAVAVEGNFARERVPADGEKEEDKERLDKEFQEELTTKEAKLAKEKGFEGWVYLVSKWTVDSLLKERKDLLQVEAEPAAPAEDQPETEQESSLFDPFPADNP